MKIKAKMYNNILEKVDFYLLQIQIHLDSRYTQYICIILVMYSSVQAVHYYSIMKNKIKAIFVLFTCQKKEIPNDSIQKRNKKDYLLFFRCLLKCMLFNIFVVVDVFFFSSFFLNLLLLCLSFQLPFIFCSRWEQMNIYRIYVYVHCWSILNVSIGMTLNKNIQN